MKKKTNTTNLDDRRAEPLGDTGNGKTGVPDGQQGISNRAGDKEDGDEDDEFEEDFDEVDESEDSEVEPNG